MQVLWDICTGKYMNTVGPKSQGPTKLLAIWPHDFNDNRSTMNFFFR